MGSRKRLMQVLLLVGVLFSGCTLWGYKEVPLEHFVPERVETSPTEWAKKAFPQRCEWVAFERIVDGDTIIVHFKGKRERLRLIGIDTPETKKEGVPVDPLGLEAEKYLKALLEGASKVCLIFDTIGDKRDRYDRLLAYLFTEEGKDINALMLSAGLAKGYFRFPYERKQQFRALESKAKEAKKGLWATPNP